MTESMFLALRDEFEKSDLTLSGFLSLYNIKRSTYYYWQKRHAELSAPNSDFIPISLSESEDNPLEFQRTVTPGITISFPNGIQAHFTPEVQGAALEVLTSKKLRPCFV